MRMQCLFLILEAAVFRTNTRFFAQELWHTKLESGNTNDTPAIQPAFELLDQGRDIRIKISRLYRGISDVWVQGYLSALQLGP